MSVAQRGFASMDKTKQQAIAAKGGRQAHKLGKAHKWTSAEASAAGKIGGKRRAKK